MSRFRSLYFAIPLVFCSGLFSVNAVATVSCADLLQDSSALLSQLKALTPVPKQPRPLEAWDYRLAGDFYAFASGAHLSWAREGNYPILIFADGGVMISHRLPDADRNPSLQTYLANHHSLYAQRAHLDEVALPAVVFAGHIRVVGRMPARLVDQSGHFHEISKDRKTLSLRNQERLELARRSLHLTLGTPLDLEILNLQERAMRSQDEIIPDGHMTDRQLALFELECRKDKQCWTDYQNFQNLLGDLIALGDAEKHLSGKFGDFHKAFGLTGFNFISTLNEALKEGALDVLAREDFRTWHLQEWRGSLPEIRKILLESK